MLCLSHFYNTTSRSKNPYILCIPFRFRIFGEQFGNMLFPNIIVRRYHRSPVVCLVKKTDKATALSDSIIYYDLSVILRNVRLITQVYLHVDQVLPQSFNSHFLHRQCRIVPSSGLYIFPFSQRITSMPAWSANCIRSSDSKASQ